ncbi:hypothetical protein AVEN_269063-1 [Araneus ventricosus]|uniref:Uncharacterized protein n=1 Tax=Araneus ventricosus TaxID=182803 RepID=A0A4Y2JF71_ARAVE|nr:hypothetical protein AVEN_269063-1 [Araneus ventricosus]
MAVCDFLRGPFLNGLLHGSSSASSVSSDWAGWKFCLDLSLLYQAGHSPLFHSTFFEAKTLFHCKIPLKIGVDRQRCWNFQEVGYPLEWMAVKIKYDSSRRAINHPCVGGRVGEGESGWELQLDWRKQGGNGVCSPPPLVGRSQSGGRTSKGIDAAVVRFGASVNDPPKSIDLNRWKTNRSLVSNGTNWTDGDFPASLMDTGVKKILLLLGPQSQSLRYYI